MPTYPKTLQEDKKCRVLLGTPASSIFWKPNERQDTDHVDSRF
jgi:hypothetical protein